MALCLLLVLAFCLFGGYAFDYYTTVALPKKNKKQNLSIFIISAFLIRIVFAVFFKGHETDMACFNSWSEMLKNDGLAEFYVSGSFTDYPPGYMYVLYLLGFIKDILGENTIFTYVILKLPAIISDILLGVCTYKVCEKHGQDKLKYVLLAFFAFNPSTVLNSAIWGQVDSVFTLFVVLMLIALTEGKMIISYFLFGIAIFIKPQALFYAPVLFYGILDNVILKDFSWKKFEKNLTYGLCAIGLVFLLALPFGINNVVSQYIATLSSYNYATVNAYNLWAALGMNWSSVNTGMNIISYGAIILIVIASWFLFFSKKEKNKYFITAAFICFSVFMLSVKMHERYAFPVLALLLCSYAISSKKEEMYFYLTISALQFVNMYHVLFCYTPETAFDTFNVTVCVVTGILSVFTLILFVKYLFKGCIKFEQKSEECKIIKDTILHKKDLMLMAIITVVYSVVALYNLGDTKSPQTFETINDNSEIVLELPEETAISNIDIYLGAQNLDSSKTLLLTFYNTDGVPTYAKNLEEGNVFCWNDYDVSAVAKQVKITSSESVYIGEIAIFNDYNERIYPKTAQIGVIDEQNTVPIVKSYRNGTYFDEIYHARSAYELIHEMPVYEWTHPPLGKTFISLGINVFGMTPFGWRIIGTLFGILMVPIFYIFTKKMFGVSWISALSTIVFSFDFMHFTQSRIATIDVYVTFFIMLMYLYMYKYVNSIGRKPIKNILLPLGLSGIFMGFAIASKWTGAYAGVGLAIIFFSAIYLAFKNNQISLSDVLKTIYFCFGAFVLVPVIIYVISYIPFVRANGGSFYEIIQNQIDMFAYHGKTVVSSTHPFSSEWYKWIVNYRPIWYYSGTNEGLSENISAFGNPIVWISGLLAFFYCVYDAVRNRDKNAIFLIIAYVVQLLPWTFVERTTFIYHYFPCVPFLVLMIAHFVHKTYQNNKQVRTYFIVFTVACVLLFIMFYPAISGFPVNGDYVRDYLRWLPSWQLIG